VKAKNAVEVKKKQSSGGADRPSERAHLSPRPSWVSQAHACTQRTFVEEAGACISSSELLLHGTLFVEQEGAVVETLDVEGSMFVASRLLDYASFHFQFAGGTASFEWAEGEPQPFSSPTAQSDTGEGLPPWDEMPTPR